MNARRSPWMPSLSTALWLAFFLALCLSQWRLVLISADSDPCLHWRIGNWMLAHHRVIDAEYFSHTRPGTPMISMEWLSQLLNATAANALGWNGFVLVAALWIATTLATLHRLLLAEHADELLALLLVLLAAFAMAHHWVARPHLATQFLTVVWIGQLRAFERGRLARGWLFATLPPLMVLWVNLHGGFLAGLILIGLFTVGTLAQPRLALTFAGLGLACLATSFINPNGWHLHAYLLDFFRQPALAGYTNEFGPANFHSPGMRGFLGVLGLLALLLIIVRPRLRATELLLLGAWGYLALKYVRNVPLFTIVAIPILAEHWTVWLRQRREEEGRTVWHRFSARLAARQQRASGYALPVLAVAAVLTRMCYPPGLTTELSANRFPTAAVAQLRAQPALLTGEMFNSYDWGGYLVLNLPEHKVFVDGRNDLYGAAFLKEFDEADQARPGWAQVLERYHVGWTILPPNHCLNAVLALEPQWREAYRDAVAVIYTRRPL